MGFGFMGLGLLCATGFIATQDSKTLGCGVQSPEMLRPNLKDQMTLKSKGPIQLYYESLHGMVHFVLKILLLKQLLRKDYPSLYTPVPTAPR